LNKKTIQALALSALTTIVATTALSHDGATGIVKERMDGMAAMGKAIKTMSVMMRGETDYDASVIKTGALSISDHAGDAINTLFPEGSVGMPSLARDEIWSQWDEFSALSDQLKAYADGLGLAAENGLATASTDGNSTASMMGTSSNAMMGTTMMGG
jgi:cytochrome c556